MRILVNNYLRDSDTSYTVNQPSVSFPIENLYNNRKLDITTFEDYIDIDLGSSINVTSLGILNESAEATIKAGTDGITYPYSITMDESVKFIDQTYRYWRVEITGAASIGYLYIGQFLQMPAFQPGSVPVWSRTDVINRSQTGATWTSPGVPLREQSFIHETTSKTEYDSIKDYYKTTDAAYNNILVQYENSIDYFEPVFCKTIFTPNQRIDNFDIFVFDIGYEEAT